MKEIFRRTVYSNSLHWAKTGAERHVSKEALRKKFKKLPTRNFLEYWYQSILINNSVILELQNKLHVQRYGKVTKLRPSYSFTFSPPPPPPSNGLICRYCAIQTKMINILIELRYVCYIKRELRVPEIN
jgi:hypothetical protein